MRGKRSKQYRKLMQQYALTFGFREPYQILVDAQMLEEAVVRFKMDFIKILDRTLHGQVKPMVTQCTIRHLYNLSTAGSSESSSKPSDKPPLTQADKTAILDVARTCEKRRCGHHELDQPLSTLECFKSVIDPKSTLHNKHRYVIACQDERTRSWARTVRGIPSIYVKRSVMILEPMAEVSIGVKNVTERDKLRSGVKRKRGETRDEMNIENGRPTAGEPAQGDEAGEKKKKKVRGPKGPNPLSMKKARPRQEGTMEDVPSKEENEAGADKKRRRRRHGGGGNEEHTITTEASGNDGGASDTNP